MAINNALNLSATGIVTHDGAGVFSGSTVTEGGVLLGGASNAISDTGVLAKGTILVGDGTTAPTELAVGTDGQILVGDSAQSEGVAWSTFSGTPTTVFIGTGTASSSAALSFTDLSATYASYLFLFDSLSPQTDSVDLYIRTSTDNGATYDTGADFYGLAYQYVRTSYSDVVDGKNTECVLMKEIGNATNETNSGFLKLINPSSTVWTSWYGGLTGHGTSVSFVNMCKGARRSAADVDAVQFLFSSGNIVSGTIKIYGIKAS